MGRPGWAAGVSGERGSRRSGVWGSYFYSCLELSELPVKFGRGGFYFSIPSLSLE